MTTLEKVRGALDEAVRVLQDAVLYVETRAEKDGGTETRLRQDLNFAQQEIEDLKRALQNSQLKIGGASRAEYVLRAEAAEAQLAEAERERNAVRLRAEGYADELADEQERRARVEARLAEAREALELVLADDGNCTATEPQDSSCPRCKARKVLARLEETVSETSSRTSRLSWLREKVELPRYLMIVWYLLAALWAVAGLLDFAEWISGL